MRIRSWSPHVRCSGFTLIEILVVLGLLGIGYALSAPSFRRTRRESVNGVQEVIDATRRIALRRGGAVRVCFEPGGPWRVESGTKNWFRRASQRHHNMDAPISRTSANFAAG
jgi:prepilin-type N-terminal cleavage/methylation domain-containing protein